jgi:hypothetical protein
VPVGCREGWDPLGVGWDEPDVPVAGRGAGALEVLEVLDVLEAGGDGELRVGDGVVTDGVLTDGVPTDGALTDGTLADGTLADGALTDGSGDDEDSAGRTAIAVIAPNIPAPTDATNHFLPLDTGCYLPAASDRP